MTMSSYSGLYSLGRPTPGLRWASIVFWANGAISVRSALGRISGLGNGFAGHASAHATAPPSEDVTQQIAVAVGQGHREQPFWVVVTAARAAQVRRHHVSRSARRRGQLRHL